MRLVALQSFSIVALGAYWVSPSRRGVTIAGHLHGVPGADRLPISLISETSSLELCSSLEFSFVLPARYPQIVSASPGVSSSFATSVGGVHYMMGFPGPTTFRPQHFSCSRRFPPPRTSWACFVPLPRPRFLFRGFPRQSFRQLFRSPYPPVVSTAEQGLAFRVLLRLSIRCSH